MAAATIADGNHVTVWGNKRVVFATLTAPADTNTWDTGLSVIENVQVQHNSASTVAADSYGVTKSAGVVTFALAGTARDVFVLAVGR